ncbi:response regulator [Pelagicoccus mobilis]|uniref:Response regulator transcription factor n=1 Tax=Pelagicoccus mobilis TaxID=415221 RepID=A0A934VQL8_9BACT|nr:response regulator transcription factor [Pelagicoccus mobilis]MBK1878482.1 response regulator transcription factor [Pelagicoccus mobilis]
MSTEGKIRIIVADDHYIVRAGLVSLLGTAEDMEVVSEASSGKEAIKVYQKHLPDVALFDLRMPGMGGVESIKQLCSKHPDAKVIVFSAFNGDEDIHKAFEAGARGYILKSSIGEDLLEAVREVDAGHKWIPRDVSSRLAIRKTYETLTPRETEVLSEIAHGRSNKEIANSLNISDYTVKDHIKNILGKLQVAARTEAVTVALQRGIIEI